jgi:hypothetical protein
MNRIFKGKIVLYLLAIFAAGALAGGFGGYSLASRERLSDVRPDELSGRINRQMQSKLRLTPEQMKQIEPSVQDVCAELRAIGYNSAVETGRAFERFNQRIAGFLSADQEEELEKFQLERKESVKRRCKSWTNAGPTKASR